MKTVFLSCWLVLSASFSLRAQSAAAPVTTTAPTGPGPIATRADTARAVHRLFTIRRHAGIVWGGAGLVAGARLIGVVNGIQDSQPSADILLPTVLVFGIASALPIGIGLGKLVRFPEVREKAVLLAYEQGHPLPKYVNRRLKKSYFAQ